MHKTYVTFGFDHVHNVNGKTLDHNTVAVLETENAEKGRERAFELFGRKFCFEYPEKFWDEAKMKYFPDGYIVIK